MVFYLVIIDDFDIMCIAISPDKADAPLPIYADRMLACAVAFQGFETIGRRNPQIFQRGCRVELGEFSLGAG